MQRFLFLLLSVAGLATPLAHGQANAPKASVDAMVNWDNPWDLTPAKFTKIAEALPRKKAELAYNTKTTNAGTAIYTIGPGTVLGTSGGGKMTLFNGAVQVDSVTAVFSADKLTSISFGLGVAYGNFNRKPSTRDLEDLKAGLAKAAGDKSPKTYAVDVRPGNPPRSGLQWTHPNYKVSMYEFFAVAPSGREEVRKGLFTVTIASP